ncbi:hypothetical protein VTI28DRAFT_690 [Corynascus sepedonium]
MIWSHSRPYLCASESIQDRAGNRSTTIACGAHRRASACGVVNSAGEPGCVITLTEREDLNLWAVWSHTECKERSRCRRRQVVRFSGCEGPSTYPDGQSGWLAGLRLTWAHRTKQCPTACLGRALVKPLRPTPQSAGLARPGLPFYEKKVEYEVLSCRSLPSHPGSKFLCRSTYTVIGHDWGPNNPLRRGELVEKRDVLERTISVLIAFPIVVTEARTQTRYSQHMMLKLSGRPTETYVSSLHPSLAPSGCS